MIIGRTINLTFVSHRKSMVQSKMISTLSGAGCCFSEFQEQRILALENKTLHSFPLEVGSYVLSNCRDRPVAFLVTCGDMEENVQNVFEERAAR